MTILDVIGDLEKELAKIVGKTNVSSEEFIRVSYSEDASPFEGNLPKIVVRPQTNKQVSKILKLAHQERISIIPVGGRSSINGSPIPRIDNSIMIDLSGMNEVIEIDENNMTVTVQAGITWSGLIHELKKKGYKLGFRGPYGGNAGTVGGSISANSIGCGASSHGSACDDVLGLELVLSTGEIIQTGSNWKDNSSETIGSFARYCTFNDMTGLFLGDHGCLAVKTSATLKIFPLPKGEAYADFGFSNLEKAVNAFHEIQKNHLVEEAVMLGDSNSIDLLASTYRSTFENINCILAVIIEEASDEIAQLKKDLVEKIIRKHGGKSIGMFLSKAHWLNMFNLVQSLFEEGFWYNTCHLRPIKTLPQLIEKFHELTNKYNLKENGINWIISALGVNHCLTSGWITLYLKDKSKEQIMHKVWDELREIEIDQEGVPYWTGKLWEPYVLDRVDKNFYNLLKHLKNSLDPNNIIHPYMFEL
ncbi:MAG: FAD-binding protein [Candidatus Lokiarchaeota archaeon]|nr:FAD-binding protein [Candidatus Lokiarchaeota archaeon]MBD3339521.1 FAD-binding protein [Candidatus Lokiarchaeota archaeon]